MFPQENFHGRHPQKDGMHSRPCIEAVKDQEAFLTEHPLDIIASGKAHRIPLMIGALSHDGLLSSIGMTKDYNISHVFIGLLELCFITYVSHRIAQE